MCITTGFPEVIIAREGPEQKEGPSTARGSREPWLCRRALQNVDFRVGRDWFQIPAPCAPGQVIPRLSALDPVQRRDNNI